jgi:D-alanyl-D-alanine carboxypeptidase
LGGIVFDMKKFQLGKSEKTLINSILKKVSNYQKKHPPAAKLDFKTLRKLLSPQEKALAHKIIKLNPKNHGFKGPLYGIMAVPKNLVVVRNQKYRQKGKTKTLPSQLVPKDVYAVFCGLNRAMKKDIAKTLLIESGYRSPAYQLIVFLYYLKFHKWNLPKVAKRVALPGYSEHGYPPRQALDFITPEGIPSDEKPLEFAKTKEYKWLLKNAKDFNFHLSYPRNNKWGVIFEPWHWSFKK